MEEEGENEDKKVGVREYSDKKRAKIKNSNSVDLPLYSSLLVGGIRKQLVELSFVIGNGRFDRYIGIRQELRRLTSFAAAALEGALEHIVIVGIRLPITASGIPW